MEISFVKISNISDIPLEVKGLYLSAFPEEERRDWSDIEQRISSGDPIFSFYVLQHDSEYIGFITLWRLPSALYCEHFALFPEMRGRGFGSGVIKEAIALASPFSFILEVELPEKSHDAERRIAFYERCGLIPLAEFPYWQPPYRKDLPEVPMMLMTSRPLSDPMAMAIILHTIVYNQ